MMTEAEIERLVRGFEDGSLPHSEWTHAAHLRAAAWYLSRRTREQATSLVRDGLQRFNRIHGRGEGYHETITLAWVAVVAGFLARSGPEMPFSEAARTLVEECGDKEYLLRYYSRELLMSAEARRGWVPPDLHPLE